jgi:hypothetical protein
MLVISYVSGGLGPLLPPVTGCGWSTSLRILKSTPVSWVRLLLDREESRMRALIYSKSTI